MARKPATRRDKRQYEQRATKTHRVNTMNPMRGGIRL